MTRTKETKAITVETLVAKAKRIVTRQVKEGLTDGLQCVFDGKVTRIWKSPPLSNPILDDDGPSCSGCGFVVSHHVVKGVKKKKAPVLMGWRIIVWSRGDLRDLEGIVLDGVLVQHIERARRWDGRKRRYIEVAVYRPQNTMPSSWIAQRLVQLFGAPIENRPR
jgi:hypothetical protein